MLWFYYALIAAFALAINGVIMRRTLRKGSIGAIATAAFMQISGALFFLPIFMGDIALPSGYLPWLIAIISGIVWSGVSIAFAFAAKNTEVSIMGPIVSSNILFVFIISVLLLSGQVTLLNSLGVLLVFAGLFAITWKKGKPFSGFRDFGVQMAVTAAILGAVGSLIDKVAMSYFSVSSYGFLEYLIPGIILTGLLFAKRQSFGSLLGHKRWIALAALFNVTSYFFNLNAYKLADIGLVYPVVSLSTPMVVIMGMIFLVEKDNAFNKILGAAAMVIGAMLLV